MGMATNTVVIMATDMVVITATDTATDTVAITAMKLTTMDNTVKGVKACLLVKMKITYVLKQSNSAMD